jgi:hypothetical protein
MNLKYKLAGKTIKTPIHNYELEFNRNYEFNRKFIAESIAIIEEGLNSHNPFCQTSLTQIARKFLAKNEDLLIRARNWSIYYMDNQNDYSEFNNSLIDIMDSMTIERR